MDGCASERVSKQIAAETVNLIMGMCVKFILFSVVF